MDYKQKLDRFNKWAAQNGIIGPKIQFPGKFDNGLIGIKCVERIEYREAYLYVPYKCLITTNIAEKVPQLKKIIDKYPLFSKESPEYEQTTLSLILLWEYQKGEESYWWPYIDLLPEFEKYTWELDEQKYLSQSHCKNFIEYAKDLKKGSSEQFEEFK